VSDIQRWARVGGALFLISVVAGGFGEAFAPTQLIVSGDATATAHNVMASNALFRFGFAGYLVEAVCDTTLAAILYVLLRPVDRVLALIATFLHLMATATFAFAELFYLIPSLLLGGDSYLGSFSASQLNTLALLCLNVYALGGDVFLLFYGFGSIGFGYLIARSGYIPWVLGALLLLGGVGFVLRNFALVLVPSVSTSFLQLPTVVAILVLGIWLLVRGVNARMLPAQ